MKYFLLIVLLFSFAVVSAEDFGAGETVQFYPVESFSSEDVKLYFNYTDLVDVNPIVKEVDGVNILYFDLPVNCSIGVYFLDYSFGNVTFNVIESENVMRISPVYYLFDKSKSSFYIELISVKGSFEVNISGVNVEPRKNILILGDGETKKLYVDYDYDELIDDGSLELSYNNLSYTIRLFYLEKVVETVVNDTVEEVVETVVNETVEEKKVPLTFLVTSPEVNLSLVSNKSVVGTLKVQNTYGENLEGLTYSLEGNILNIVSFREETYDLVDGEIIETEFVFNGNENATVGTYSGNIVFGNDENEVILPVNVYVNDIQTAVTSNDEIVLGEEIIFVGETLEEESSNWTIIIGISLILLMLFLITVVIIKLRQRPEKMFNQYIEETKKKK